MWDQTWTKVTWYVRQLVSLYLTALPLSLSTTAITLLYLAVPVFLIWLNLAGVLVLSGAVFVRALTVSDGAVNEAVSLESLFKAASAENQLDT